MTHDEIRETIKSCAAIFPSRLELYCIGNVTWQGDDRLWAVRFVDFDTAPGPRPFHRPESVCLGSTDEMLALDPRELREKLTNRWLELEEALHA